jgi:hypothetical protein
VKRLAVFSLLALAACHHRVKREPPVTRYDVTVPASACVYHAVAAAPIEGGWMVAGACAGNDEGGAERIIATRIDDHGLAGTSEDVELLSAGWATNVLVASTDQGGALVGWTAATPGGATATIAAIDAQGNATGDPVAVAPGRALAIAGDGRGVALAVITEPDALSDDADAPGATLTVYTLDPEGQITGHRTITTSAQAVRPFVSLAARPGGSGWIVAWPERGAALVAELGPHAEPDHRGVASTNVAGLPPGARFWMPAVAGGANDTARVAAVVSGGSPVSGGDPSGEIWIGEGTVGATWTWRPIVKDVSARLGGLALAGAARGDDAVIAWTETRADRDFAQLASIRVGDSRPQPIFDAAVLFDGAVALAWRNGRALYATSVPPTAGHPSELSVSLR